ncbi:MAG: hypothetical protein ABI882_22370 [Acidobacteriota bacterium]
MWGQIKSACTLLIDPSTRGMRNALFRSLTGVIETNAQGGRAGDIDLEFDGALNIKSVCGQIRVGPSAWIVTWGENPGTGAINFTQTGSGDLVIDGLVMNRTNHTPESNRPPTINGAFPTKNPEFPIK